MLDFKIEVKANGRPTNFNAIVAMLAKVPTQKFDDVFTELVDIGNDVRNDIIDSMTNTKTNTNKGGKTHRASTPGSPPARDSGELIAHIIESVNTSRKTVEMGSTKGAVHGRYLETGTKKMQARPWLNPAFRRGNVKNRIISALNKEARF